MDPSAIITLSSSIISLIAAAYIGVRQYITQKSSNSVTTNFEILRQLQEYEFHDNFDFAIEKLKDYDPEAGLVGLPVEARRKVLNACFFFQHIAMLIILDLIDERVFTAYFRARTVALWKVVEPFVQKERVLNLSTGPEFLSLFEAFAIKANRTTPEVGQEILRKWVMKGT